MGVPMNTATHRLRGGRMTSGEPCGGGRRAGFSLVEVLVVMVVLALLLALVVPALQSAKEQARTLVCKGHVRTFATAMSAYAYDHGHFPHGLLLMSDCHGRPPDGFAGNAVYDWQGWWWFDFAIDYLSVSRNEAATLVRCPAHKPVGRRFSKDYLWGNYGINQSVARMSMDDRALGFVGKPLRPEQIEHADLTLLLVDSGYALISWRAVAGPEDCLFHNARRADAYYLPGLNTNKDRTFGPNYERDAILGRHPRRTVNAGFVDGHVERRSADSLGVTATEDGGYVNRYPLWMPRKSPQD